MRSSILLFASGLTTVLAVPAPQTSGTLGLGAQCTSSSDCANGADCYSTNSGLVRQCGNFQASCSSDSQCAYNTCVNGLCNGFKATTTASSAAATGTPTTVYIPVGKQCSPNSTPCANGSSCYSTNSGLITICGNFQAECQNDSQCAFNTCKGGLCNGFLSTSSAATPATSTQASYTTSSAESTSTASSLALGANCTPGSTPCADGATCYAVNSGLQPRCGNFQASCTTDAQCAFNTCNKGLCNGYLASSGSSSVAPVTSSGAAATTTGDASPAASTAVVVTTPIVTESSVVVVGASATSASGSSSSTATSSAAAVLNTNAASSSKSGPLGLAFAGAVAIAALI